MMSARRIAAAIALAAVVVAGLAVHVGLPDSAASDIAGDALYAVAVYAGLALLCPRARSAPIAIAAAGWCIAVELFQLTGVPNGLAAEVPLAALVFGTGFDARDLIVYPFAVMTAAVTDLILRRRRGMPGAEGRLTTT